MHLETTDFNCIHFPGVFAFPLYQLVSFKILGEISRMLQALHRQGHIFLMCLPVCLCACNCVVVSALAWQAKGRWFDSSMRYKSPLGLHQEEHPE